MNDVNRSMKRRIKVSSVIIAVLCISLLGGNIFYIQFMAKVDGKSYAQKASDQQLKDLRIQPERGTIYDCNMKPLAQNASAWTVELFPSEIAKIETAAGEDEDGAAEAEAVRNKIADALSEVLVMDRTKIYEMTKKDVSYVEVKRKVEKTEADVIAEFIKKEKLTCLKLTQVSKRYYPYGEFCSTVLGFTGTDNQGLSGVEAYYDEELTGKEGRIVALKDAKNVDMEYQYETVVDAEDGSSLVLTINEVVQHIVEKHVEDALIEQKVANRATAIVMDVKTGEILAMTTKPEYNPNEPFTIVNEKISAALAALSGDAYAAGLTKAQQAQWKNKATSEVYEPGSVFKIITAAAAMEEDVVDVNDTFYCSGSYKVADRTIHCWKAGGHGAETFLDGIKNSCNPVFMQVAERLGSEKFYQYFEAFGLTEKTGIDLPGEESGIYHTLDDLGPVELAVSSFGQTFKVTPLQLITAVSAVANGGYLMQPHLVKSIISADGVVQKTVEPVTKRQVISEATSKQLCAMLEQVVATGTGKNAYVRGFRVAGKTGTSEKIDQKDAEGKPSTEVVASFCGFAPADDPQVAVIVVLDEPNGNSTFGGVIAAPIVGAIMADILPVLEVEPIYTAKEMADMQVKTPDVVKLSVSDATAKLKKAGLKVRTVGTGTTVLSQTPAAGRAVPQDGTVVLTLSAETKTVVVPNVIGLTAANANDKITSKGLNIAINGTNTEDSDAQIAKQTPAAGQEVLLGTVVTVELRHKDYVE